MRFGLKFLSPQMSGKKILVCCANGVVLHTYLKNWVSFINIASYLAKSVGSEGLHKFYTKLVIANHFLHKNKFHPNKS